MVAWEIAPFSPGKKMMVSGVPEFVNGLAAGSTGLACGVVKVCDRDGANANCGAVKTDRRCDGSLLGTDGEAI